MSRSLLRLSLPSQPPSSCIAGPSSFASVRHATTAYMTARDKQKKREVSELSTSFLLRLSLTPSLPPSFYISCASKPKLLRLPSAPPRLPTIILEVGFTPLGRRRETPRPSMPPLSRPLRLIPLGETTSKKSSLHHHHHLRTSPSRILRFHLSPLVSPLHRLLTSPSTPLLPRRPSRLPLQPSSLPPPNPCITPTSTPSLSKRSSPGRNKLVSNARRLRILPRRSVLHISRGSRRLRGWRN